MCSTLTGPSLFSGMGSDFIYGVNSLLRNCVANSFKPSTLKRNHLITQYHITDDAITGKLKLQHQQVVAKNITAIIGKNPLDMCIHIISGYLKHYNVVWIKFISAPVSHL